MNALWNKTVVYYPSLTGGPGNSPLTMRSKSPLLTARETHARLKWYSAYFLIISR